MIDYQEVLEIHQVLIREFGGSQGVRDENGLKSALERPFSGFGETEFYPNPEEKAGAILESIVKNHPFILKSNCFFSYPKKSIILQYETLRY
jgi:death-on-curing protein